MEERNRAGTVPFVVFALDCIDRAGALVVARSAILAPADVADDVAVVVAAATPTHGQAGASWTGQRAAPGSARFLDLRSRQQSR